MKACLSCGVSKALDQFQRHGRGQRNQCRDCRNAVVRQWKRDNPVRSKKWDRENPERMRAARRTWAAANPHRTLAITRRYQAAKARALPAWAKAEAMADVYRLARERTAETGVQHEVDHIVPLVSELVCGFHCEDNLRVIPMAENRAKSNRLVLV